MGKRFFLLCLIMILILGFKQISWGAIYEYPTIYKDPGIMAMGGAYNAIGGSVNALFYNPAGLSNIDPKKGYEVCLLKLSGTASSSAVSFVNDFMDILDIDNDTEQQTKLNNLISKHLGDDFYLDLQTMPLGIARNFGTVSFGLAIFGSAQGNFIPHQGAGIDGVIEISSKDYVGIIAGISYQMKSEIYGKYGRFKLGVGVKYLSAGSINHSFRTAEIIENSDDFTDYIKDNYYNTGQGIGFDVGVLYVKEFKRFVDIQLGVSVMNIGDLDLGDAGTIPMSVDTGIALKPHFKGFKGFFKDPVIALDVVDITKNNGVDEDWGKRIRAGVGFKLIDSKFLSCDLKGGLYQGYPAFGMDLDLFIFSFQFATYAEEIGAYAGQKENRRYTASISIKW